MQYKQNKSTTLFTLYPERKAFTALFVYGRKEMDEIEKNEGKLSPETYRMISETHQYHDGKWIWYRVKDKIGENDLYALMGFKKKPA